MIPEDNRYFPKSLLELFRLSWERKFDHIEDFSLGELEIVLFNLSKMKLGDAELESFEKFQSAVIASIKERREKAQEKEKNTDPIA